MSRTVVWFSCGVASAVAAKIVVSDERFDNVVIARCRIDEEHPDNDRFSDECQEWFQQEIVILESEKFGSSICNVFEKERYMSGPYGASCTRALKRRVREAFQEPDDVHVFGYCAEEAHRVDRFIDSNNDIEIYSPLVEAGLSHKDCLAIVGRAGIEIPEMYKLGYKHNNCIGCVKSSSAGYWNKVRETHPLVFKHRAEQSRDIGCKLVKVSGKRVFLDELPAGVGNYKDEDSEIECGIFCEMAERQIREGA